MSKNGNALRNKDSAPRALLSFNGKGVGLKDAVQGSLLDP